MRKLCLCLCLVALGCTNKKPRTWDLVEQDTIYLNDEERNIINIIDNATTIEEIFPADSFPDDIGCYRPSDDSIYIYRE